MPKAAKPHAPEIALLLRLLDDAFETKAWHGPNLRGALRGVPAAVAAWRPGPKRHNLWELALHAAYWKYAVRQRLTGGKRGDFPLRGSNWFPRPEGNAAPDESTWRRDVALLVGEHRSLREVVAAFPPARLHAKVGRSRWTAAQLIAGAAQHDLYHTGQIQMLKRLAAGK